MSISLYCLQEDPLINHWKGVCSDICSRHNVEVIAKPVSDLCAALSNIDVSTSCVLHFEGKKSEQKEDKAVVKLGNFVETLIHELANPSQAAFTNPDDRTLVVNPDLTEKLDLQGDANKPAAGSTVMRLASDTSDTSLSSITIPISPTTISQEVSVSPVTPMSSSKLVIGSSPLDFQMQNDAQHDIENIAVPPVSLSSTSPTQSSDLSGSSSITTDDTQLEIDSGDEPDPDKMARKKEQHMLHHAVHEDSADCPFYKSIDLCRQNYDDKLAKLFKHYVKEWKLCDKMFEECIVHHLSKKICGGTGCPLWKVSVNMQLYSALKYADEGLVVHSKLRNEIIGEVCKDYLTYKDKVVIGHGGFGKVYKLNAEHAVKEEYKRPLAFLNLEVFKRILELNNTVKDHVIPLLEYIVGGLSHDDPIKPDKRVFLFVMPYMNRGGLHKLFRLPKPKCILQYMVKLPGKEECIFRNYRLMFLHTFKGLNYLHNKGIVHGDVKESNILVHQTCICESPLVCTCGPGDNKGVTYVLGDMDLFCIDGENLSGEYVRWARAKFTEPSGTRDMKATELYFTGMKGEKCGSTATDIWAGSVTMMKLLVGDEIIKEATQKINEYFDAISIHSTKHVISIGEACTIARELKRKIKVFDLSKERDKDKAFHKQQVSYICDQFDKMTQVSQSTDIKPRSLVMSHCDVRHELIVLLLHAMGKLLTSGEFLKQAHWISSYTYPEKLPLPFILGAVHGANSLHQQCLGLLPHVYSISPKSLWGTMQKVLEIITSGVRFLPNNRPDAASVISTLDDL